MRQLHERDGEPILAESPALQVSFPEDLFWQLFETLNPRQAVNFEMNRMIGALWCSQPGDGFFQLVFAANP